MIFLYSTISSLKSIFVMVVSHRQLSYVLCFSRASPRTSPCLGRSPLVGLACCWLCSCLACCWPRSSACCWLCFSACCWLCSSRLFPSFLPFSTLSAALRAHRRFKFFSLSSYPCCSFIFFSPLARLLWFCLGFSPLAPWLWFLLHFSLATGFLAVGLSLILPRGTLW